MLGLKFIHVNKRGSGNYECCAQSVLVYCGFALFHHNRTYSSGLLHWCRITHLVIKYDDCRQINRRWINTLRPRQNGRHFADDIFKWIFLNDNVWIAINISLKFTPRGPINNIPTLVQVMAWRRPGDKPLSEPMMVRLPTHISVTRPQWVTSMEEYPRE